MLKCYNVGFVGLACKTCNICSKFHGNPSNKGYMKCFREIYTFLSHGVIGGDVSGLLMSIGLK